MNDPIKDALMAALGYVKGETYGYAPTEEQRGPDEIIAELEHALEARITGDNNGH